ncbi:folate-binding protein YgfZ [Mesorhizobium sp. RP14(2022)]|uniref:Folate-binding protein YgfZ n=2 Tax=Mesorhizobium liriopis TaxID=2953882 RepID=A0ABT1C7A9_9HYPH|nr:folate-binding protein YgfZ [Mesorhizobium liriopis]MCO6050710.1 folate-binding protein YgfZ [Mesorhizobium liriopis]
MPSAILSNRALLRLSGEDAASFLQNLVTTDIDLIGNDEIRASALLSPQGKVMFDFLVSRDGEELLLETRADIAADLAKRLTLYKLRAKVVISQPEQVVAKVFWDDDSASVMSGSKRDTRFKGLVVWRVYLDAGQSSNEDEWNRLRIASGVVESGSDYALGDAFPHDISFDQNSGVGFGKGCFVGQEVVSRMKHRGTARRRVLILEGSDALPVTGTDVTANGRPLGSLGTVDGNKALAILRIDRVADALNGALAILAGSVPVTASLPPDVSYSFPADTTSAQD